jgi:hypothetical protein
VADAGATGHYFRASSSPFLSNLQVGPPVTVTTPNGGTIVSTRSATLDIGGLSGETVHLFDDSDLIGMSLLSIGALCDRGCDAKYTRHRVSIRDPEGRLVAVGHRDRRTGLYLVDISRASRMPTAAGAIWSETKAQTLDFWVAALGSPPTSSILKAIALGLRLPGLTASALRKYNPRSMATAKGHLQLVRQGLRSTSASDTDDLSPEEVGPLPPKSGGRKRDQDIYTRIFSPTGRIHADGAGRFPVTSKSGNNHVIVFYSEDGNYIHCEATKTRKAGEITTAYRKAVNFFVAKGVAPTFFRMDNETSGALEDFIREEAKCTIQYVAPNNHRQNRAERCIQTFKNHFVSMLATTDPSFPMSLWDTLLTQAELTINLLRESAINPRMSAWEQLHGPYDFGSTPIAPVGMPVLVFEAPAVRGSWAPHGKAGFYIGPAMSHYRCFNTYVLETGRERVTDTLSWHPTALKLPGSSPLEELTSAVKEVSAAYKRILSTPPAMLGEKDVLSTLKEPVMEALRELAEVYGTRPPLGGGPGGERLAQVGDSHTTRDTDAEPSSDTGPSPDTDGPPPGFAPLSDLPPVDEVSPPATDAHSGGGAPDTSSLDGVASPPPASTCARPATGRRQRVPRRRPGSKSSVPGLAPGGGPVPQVSAGVRPATRRRQRVPQEREKAGSDPYARSYHPRIPGTRRVAATLFSDHEHARLACTSVDLDTEGRPLTWSAAMGGPDRESWIKAEVEEWLRLIETSGTLRFVSHSTKPKCRLASYYNPQVKLKKRPDGSVEFRVRGTYGGDRSDWRGPRSALTASITTVKVLLNAVVSEENARWMTADITDFYLGTPLPRNEYMRVHTKYIPREIMDRYGLSDLVKDDHVMVEIYKGIYGLPQAGILAQERLVKHLSEHGYHAAKDTPCLFLHDTRPVAFSLVVDDFGIKYEGRENAEHLLQTLRLLYKIRHDEEGQKYLGITIRFDRSARLVTMQMPGYVGQALKRFGHDPRRTSEIPCKYVPPRYGKYTQFAEVDSSPRLGADGVKRIQEIVGVFSYYARVMDSTMLCAVTKLASSQSMPTGSTMAAAELLLDYAEGHQDAVVTFRASSMVYHVHSDASYLSESGARSRAGGRHYLGDAASARDSCVVNGSVLDVSTIIDVVCSSAFEAEYGALFINGKEAAAIRATLADLGYPQGRTQMITDNTTAQAIAAGSAKQKRSKAVDMRFHWIRDRVRQKQFDVVWEPGERNLADFFTKAHPVSHFRRVSARYVTYP